MNGAGGGGGGAQEAAGAGAGAKGGGSKMSFAGLPRVGSFGELRRKVSVDYGPPLPNFDSLDGPLTAKTDLIDELSTVWPLNVKAPGLIVLGARHSGKSTILQTLTGVPLPHKGPQGSTRRPLKVLMVGDPTAKKTYALVGNADFDAKDQSGTICVEKLSHLPRIIARMSHGAPAGGGGYEDDDEGAGVAYREEDRGKPIYIKVVRPKGPTYTFVDLPGIDENDPESVRLAEGFLKEDSASLILAVLPVRDVFDRAFPVKLAKKFDPESKRTVGVVTKVDLVEKDMILVEKLQMTSQRELNLPLGYIAVVAAFESGWARSRSAMLERERVFFATNPLLQGLRPERRGTVTLKQLIINFQCNAISTTVPGLTRRLHDEIDDLDRQVLESGRRIEDHQEFFTKLCSDATALAFEIEDLATSSNTRPERQLNLGARLAAAIRAHEEQARKSLPEAVAAKVGAWQDMEANEAGSGEPRIYVSRESLCHDLFRRAVRDVCGPVLKVYITELLDDVTSQLKDVIHVLIKERFGGFPWLVESLKHEVVLLLDRKKAETGRVLDRIINAEMGWVFVNESDLNNIEREVALNMAGKTAGGFGGGKAVPLAQQHDTNAHWSAELSKIVSAEELDGSQVVAPTQMDPSRDTRIRQLALDAYVRLMLRRVFYAVPMNIRNVLLNEFRKDLVAMVADKYNAEAKLRTVMSEEIFLGQLRGHRQNRKEALVGLLGRLDRLS